MASEMARKNDALQERNRALHAARQIMDTARDEGRATTAEERASIAKAMDAHDRYLLETVDYEVAPPEETRLDLPDSEAAPMRVDQESVQLKSILRNRNGAVSMNFSEIAHAADDRRQRSAAGMESRALQRVATDGIELIPEGFLSEMYDYMQYYSGMRMAGCRVITTATGNDIPMPVVNAQGTAAMVAELGTAAGVEPQFEQVILKSYKAAQLIMLSNELITDEGVNLMSWLAQDMGRAIARVTDTKYVTGNGTSEPQGFITAASGAGNQRIAGTAAGGAIDFDGLIKMKYAVDPGYAMNATWVINWATCGLIAAIKDADGQYLWQPSKSMNEPDMLLGRPVQTDPNIPVVATSAKSVFFGDWDSAVVIRDVATLDITVSEHHWFHRDALAIRSTFRTDSRVRDDKAISHYFGATS